MNFEEAVEALTTDQIHDFHDEPLTREQFLEKVLWEMLTNEEHSLYSTSEGDGYQEPYSESWHCSCTEQGAEGAWNGPRWIQTNPQCSTRVSLDEVLHEWQNHLNYERSILW